MILKSIKGCQLSGKNEAVDESHCDPGKDASPLVGAAILIVTVFDFSSRQYQVGNIDVYLSR
jgi:hypothetical protein